MSDNPLLHISDLPNHAPRFAAIEEHHYMLAVEESIKMARANIEKIKSNVEAPNFKNTIEALESASEILGQVTSIFYNNMSANGNDAVHALAEKIGPLTAAYSSDVILDEALFDRVGLVYDQKDKLDLNDEQMMLLTETRKSFVRGGALLDDKKKERLREISQELSVISPGFMNNVNKSAEAFELLIEDEADLSGLPDSAKDAAAHAASEKGKEGQWRFTLDYPSFGPFLQYADNRALREQIWRAFSNCAYGGEYDNCANVMSVVKLRDERAKLLGFETHAHYVLEERMAKSPEGVLSFLERLRDAYKPAAQADLARLKEFAKDLDGLDDIQPWDIGYYAEKLKEKLFDFSSEDFRPYLQLDKVLDGCFTHFEKLFGIRFEDAKAKGYEVYHEDVQVFEVYNASDDSFVGTLFADFHPRVGKKPGAWKTTYRNQGMFNGTIERPLVKIVCNFTKPTADKPSLITHGELTTLFHEMGHAVHALLSDVRYRSLAGTSVLWDFVELPSQLMENWCYEKETLDLFASHYETGESIPEDLIQKLRAAKNFMSGWGGLRQVGLGLLDMRWHTASPSSIKDVASFEDEATEDTRLFERLGGPSSSSFNHIFAGGYSAGYYSYKWAEVLDADTYELFLENGLYDQAAAKKLKDEILSRGGTEHPSVLYKNFRGRDADPDALLRREGLLAASKAA